MGCLSRFDTLRQGDCREETWRAYQIPISAENGLLGSQASTEKKIGCEF